MTTLPTAPPFPLQDRLVTPPDPDRIRLALRLVSGRWTLDVLVALMGGTRRYCQLLRRLDGVSDKVLTQTLRAMERDGLIVRRVYPDVPMRVEYTLTPLGRTLIDPLCALERWSADQLELEPDGDDHIVAA